MKLLLNVRIWDGMAVEMVGVKQIRFLTVETDEDGSPKVNTYLITVCVCVGSTLGHLWETWVRLMLYSKRDLCRGVCTAL